MSTNTQKYWIIGIVVVAVIALAIGALIGGHSSSRSVGINNGAQLINYPEWFTNQTGSGAVVYAGRTQQWAVTDAGAETVNGITNTGTTQLSSTGTNVNRINFGLCDALAYSNTIAASTTAQLDCSLNGGFSTLTGVQSGDNVFITSTTSLSTVYQGVDIIGSRASSTAGYITLEVSNQTGTTFTWSGAASTSLAYFVIH